MCDLSKEVVCQHQENHAWCAYAISEAYLHYYNKKKTYTDEMPTQTAMEARFSPTKKSKTPVNILKLYGIKFDGINHGAKDKWNEDNVLKQLDTCLSAGHPVLAGICLPGVATWPMNSGETYTYRHAIMIVGVSISNRTISITDPAGTTAQRRNRVVSLLEFMDGYHYCDVTDFGPKTNKVLKTDEIPNAVKVVLYRIDWKAA